MRSNDWTGRASVAVVLGLGAAAARAEVRLPHVFGDHLVLQRGVELPVWGWAAPGEAIEVELAGAPPVATTADADGEWRVDLAPREAGGPYTLTVRGSSTLVLEDVLVGEVWLCSGQSNMEWTLDKARDAEAEIAAAEWPRIRHLKVPLVPAGAPASDFTAEWEVCTPATAGDFTAVGYFFARELQGELDVPVGLLNSSWGGTAIEPWTPPVGFASVPALQGISERVALATPGSPMYRRALSDYLASLGTWVEEATRALEADELLRPAPSYPAALSPLASHAEPTGLYNGMIAPLVPYAIRGALWYQGETNRLDGKRYTDKTRALVQGWREVWGEGEFPFYYVQIAPYRYGDEDPSLLPAFWEAQAAALELPSTGMVVTNDIANLDDIHPGNKQDVGRRLALLALRGTYGREEMLASGPTFRELEVEGDRLRVSFDDVGDGLVTRDGEPPSWFEVIGDGVRFSKAEAVIDGDSVVLSSPEVATPRAMRFAWDKCAEPNLMNSAGLPAGAFRAGEIPRFDPLTASVPEAAEYELVYELDLGTLGPVITYGVDRSAELEGPFDRIAYCLELQKEGEGVQFAYVSMDAFTDDLRRIGIPTAASGASFRCDVAALNVWSNVEGVAGGVGLGGGNIELWPANYATTNSAGVPGASNDVYDFGDEPSPPTDGYGCLQVHDHEAGVTILAVNHWRDGAGADLGIGNSPGGTRDWTFHANAGGYEWKRLRVLVRPVAEPHESRPPADTGTSGSGGSSDDSAGGTEWPSP